MKKRGALKFSSKQQFAGEHHSAAYEVGGVHEAVGVDE